MRIVKTSFILLTAILLLLGLDVYFPLHSHTLPKKGLLPAVDSILVKKSQRKMELYAKGQLVKEYKISLGFAPTGPKQQEGDGKTPEGQYTIISKNPNSQFHKSLKISYPNADDKKKAKNMGVTPGGDIMIHGLGRQFSYLGKLHTLHDWTLGCIAVTNEEIEEIWAIVKEGTSIKIEP